MRRRRFVSRRAALALAVACALGVATPAAAQDFVPPSSGAAAASNGLRVDLMGFSTRVGADVTRGGSLVLGSAFDVAELWSPQVRLRPSFEFSAAGSSRSLHVAAEVVYRFQPDRAAAIPYAGIGVGYFVQDSTSAAHAGQRRVWLNLVMGFELAFRPSFNWLLEYHALDRLGRHRFLVGLSTRGGGAN
jgi:hypothetical protein